MESAHASNAVGLANVLLITLLRGSHLADQTTLSSEIPCLDSIPCRLQIISHHIDRNDLRCQNIIL
jgi:hypothetical protein